MLSQRQHNWSYPPVIKSSLSSLLSLEKHSCQKRQHSVWNQAPQHLTEHGKKKKKAFCLSRKPDKKCRRVPRYLAAKSCLLQAWSEVLHMSRLRSNCEKQRCGLHLPNNPVQSLTGRFFKCWCKIAAKQHWTGKLWVGGSTAVIEPQPHNYQSRFSLTWFRTLTVSKPFQISAHHKRIFLNRNKFPSCKPEEKLYFSLTADVQRSFREAWTETLSFVLLGLRTKKNPVPHLALHYVSCLHKSILSSSPFHVALPWFFCQMFPENLYNW